MTTTRRPVNLKAVMPVLRVAAVLGFLLGLETLVLHLLLDPLADVHAYYDAGSRLNAGQPLYLAQADPDAPDFYRYPPLLAIVFRPLALLPFQAAAFIWESLLIVVSALTIRRLGVRERTLLVLGWLALPLLWTLAVGQAQALVTYLLTVGSPFAVATAANLKVFPALVAISWVGRRDWRSLGMFAAWMAVLAAFQLILAPADTLAYLGFLSLSQVGEVENRSLYAVSPALWGISVALMVVVAIRLAPTRYGWAAAVVLSVFATPRLLIYQLSTLVAGLRDVPKSGAAETPDRAG